MKWFYLKYKWNALLATKQFHLMLRVLLLIFFTIVYFTILVIGSPLNYIIVHLLELSIFSKSYFGCISQNLVSQVIAKHLNSISQNLGSRNSWIHNSYHTNFWFNHTFHFYLKKINI